MMQGAAPATVRPLRAFLPILAIFASFGRMPTRNINLTDHFDRFIAENIESGRYKNASEVVRDALRALQKQHLEDAAKLERLREAIHEGADDIERGRYLDLAENEIGPYVARKVQKPPARKRSSRK
jgi:antitoxin ParD1/3/4